MIFRYYIRTPDNQEHSAIGDEAFNALIAALVLRFPDGELELRAELNDAK